MSSLLLVYSRVLCVAGRIIIWYLQFSKGQLVRGRMEYSELDHVYDGEFRMFKKHGHGKSIHK